MLLFCTVVTVIIGFDSVSCFGILVSLGMGDKFICFIYFTMNVWWIFFIYHSYFIAFDLILTCQNLNDSVDLNKDPFSNPKVFTGQKGTIRNFGDANQLLCVCAFVCTCHFICEYKSLLKAVH